MPGAPFRCSANGRSFGRQQLRAFPVHPNSRQPRRLIEAVALIGPPAIDAEVVDAACDTASSTATARSSGHLSSGVRPLGTALSGSAGVVHGPGHAPPFDDDVQHDVEVLRVQLVDHLPSDRESSPSSTSNSPLRVFQPDGVNSVPR